MSKLIKTTIYLVASLLLLSCLPNYADEEQIATYYTFVMYKAPNDSQWELPSYPIKAGSYRFQIVYMNPHEDNNLQWIALRGEFEFEKDTREGGVKLKNTYTLNLNPQFTENKLKNAISQSSKPLIDKMNKLRRSGDSIPNFIRFLIRQTNGVEDKWTYNGKPYHIYRLHYLKDQLRQEKQTEIISRFINPNQPPATDINELKKWVDDNENFKLAEYLGKPDNRHVNFYKKFKAWFNKRYYYNHINKPNSESMSEEENDSNWVSIILAILFVVIVIISIIFYFKDKLKGFLLKYKKNYVSKSEFDNLKKELLQINNQLIKLAPLDIDDNKLSQLVETEIKTNLDKNFGNYFHLLKKELQPQINNELAQLVPAEIDYNQLSQFIETEVRKYLNKNLNTYLKSYLEPYIKNEPTSAQTLPDKINDIQAYTTPTTTPKPPQKPTDNTITQIKTLLLSNKLLNDEAALNSLDTNVDPCTFVINLVGNCLKFNQPLNYSHNINEAIKNITNNKISLLIPNVGDDISAKEHNIMGQQIVNKGKLNVVGVFIRPGVKCDGVIKRKAEVIQNV